MNGIITIKQLPEITEQLAALSEKIDSDVSAALALEVNSDTVKEVKAVRAQLTKDFNALEARRKEVKKAILAPYEEFEAIYKSVVGKYPAADATLKTRVDEVENAVKAQKENALAEYYTELCTSTGIDFIPMTRAGINVTLSASLKSLKEQASAFVSGIAASLSAIEDMENSAEILVEYKKSLNFAEAVKTVNARLAAIEEQKRIAEENAAKKTAQAEAVAKVEAAMPPPTAPLAPPTEAKRIVSCQFFSQTTGEIFERRYSYYCDIPVATGQKVLVETAKGQGKAIVCETNVDPSTVSADTFAKMKNVVGYYEYEEPKADTDPVKTLQFSVTAPLSKLRELKAFLDEKGYQYE